MWTNRSSSDYTKRLQDKTRFAAYLQNKQSVTTGNAVNLPIDSGSGKNGANSEWTQIQQAPPFVSAEEYSTIVGTPSYILPDPTELVVQQYTSVGSFEFVVPRLTRTVEYLVVGGGGGSGPGYDNGGGGGGGAGVVLTGTLNVRGDQRYIVTVGDGGSAGTVDRTVPLEVSGGAGETSVFGSIQAVGGEGGFGSRQAPGGSGAGGAITTDTSGGGAGNGGGGGGGGVGGGGNGSAGGNKSGATAGTGGTGVSNSISGSAVTYGVGGDGATGNTTAAGVAGTANRGNGAKAGGGASSSEGQGAAGGSGIVILRFYK